MLKTWTQSMEYRSETLWKDWRLLDKLPDPPEYDAKTLGPLPKTALQCLKDLGDPRFPALLYQEQVTLYRYATESWFNLRDTFNPADWAPVLNELGCDVRAARCLMCLAQQGAPGRAQANRLLWQFMKESMKDPYLNAAQVWQASIRQARKRIDEPPEDHRDWQAWTPHKSLVGEWSLLEEYAPLDCHGNMVFPGAPSAPGPATVTHPDAPVPPPVWIKGPEPSRTWQDQNTGEMWFQHKETGWWEVQKTWYLDNNGQYWTKTQPSGP